MVKTLRQEPTLFKTFQNANESFPLGFLLAFNAVEQARARLDKAEKKSKIRKAKEALSAFEIDLAWCRYYPLQYPWQQYPPPGSRELPVNSTKTRKGRNRFWQMVKKSFEDGTLLDLRAGKFGGVSDVGADDDDNVGNGKAQSAGG